jgi:hypothetical protein
MATDGPLMATDLAVISVVVIIILCCHSSSWISIITYRFQTRFVALESSFCLLTLDAISVLLMSSSLTVYLSILSHWLLM